MGVLITQHQTNDSRIKLRLILQKTLILGFFIIFYPIHNYGQTNFSVNNDGPDETCSSAWPTEILGNYYQNGTNNDRVCYEGPNGYWLYHQVLKSFGSTMGSYWVVGKPLGNNDINGADVRHYIESTTSTPPLNIRFVSGSNGCGYLKISDAGAIPPPAPDLNNPYDVGSTSMKLSWSQEPGTTEYHVYVSTNSSFTAMVTGHNPKVIYKGSNPYTPSNTTLSGLSRGTKYYIRVRSYSGAGESGNSNTVSASTAPEAPSANAASDIKDITFKANWDPADQATSYKLYVSENSSFSNHISGFNGKSVSSTSYTVTGVTSNKNFYYRIKAINNSGTSAYSNSTSLKTASPAPVVGSANNISQTSFTANWNESSEATGYYLDVSTSSTFSNFVSGYENKNLGNNLSTSVTGLSTGTIYYYQVRSYNSIGTSTNSASSNLITFPGVPTATNAATIQMTSFNTNWNSVQGANGYRLDVATDINFNNLVSGYNNLDVGNVTTYTVNSNLSAGTTYFYRIKAYNNSGTGNNSNTITLETAPNPPNTQASNITFSNIHATKLTLSWTNGNGGKRAVFAKEASAGNASPEHYNSYSPDEDFKNGDQIGSTGWYCVYNGTETSVTVKNLFPATEYIFMLTEFNGTSPIETYNTSSNADNPRSQVTQNIMINELDAYTEGTDDLEFIELYDGGIGNLSLDGLVLVFYDGSDNQSYEAYDLDGYTTDANGYFVLGNASVSGTDLTFSDNSLQNGADAVALYMANSSDFPNNTALTTDNLVDAVVYDNGEGVDATLLTLLESGDQLNENHLNSMQRIKNGEGNLKSTTTYQIQPPTPGTRNNALPISANGNITADEDLNKTLAITDFTYSDADSDPMLQIQLTVKPDNGTLFIDVNDDGVIDAGEELANNDTILKTQIAANKLKYLAALNEFGSSYTTFEFKVHDGLAYSASSDTMTINVTAVNDLPTASDDTVTTPEDTDKVFASSEFNYSDIESSAMQQIQITTLPDTGILYNDTNTNGVVDSGEELAQNDVVTKAHIDANQLKFKPSLNEFGSPYTSFNFKVHDSTAYSNTSYKMTIDVTSVNDLPTSSDSSFATPINTDHVVNAGAFLFNDVDGDDLDSVLIVTVPVKGSIYYDADNSGTIEGGESIGNNSFVTRAMLDSDKLKYKPITGENGQPYTTFSFKVNDGTGSSAATYTMTINVFPEFIVGGIAEDMIICHNGVPNPITGLAPTGGNPPYSYQWQSSVDGVNFNDIAGATELDYQPGVLSDTTYFRQIQTSSSGCGTRITNTVTVYTLEEFIAGSLSSDQTLCYNSTPAKLIGTAPTGGKLPYTYQWQQSLDGNNFTDLTGETSLEYQPTALTQSTWYRILQTSGSGCGTVATNVVRIKIHAEFKAGSISKTQVLYYRTLPEKFTGTPPTGGMVPYTYQWQQSTDGETFSDIYGADELDYQAGRLSRTTRFRLKQTSASGCGTDTTNTVMIIVFPEFKAGSIEADQQIVYNSVPEKLTATEPRGGRHPYSYQWQSSLDSLNFVDIEGETNLDYQPPALIQTTYYRQIQSAALGYADKATNVVTIFVYPEFKVGSIAESQLVCFNSPPGLILGTVPTGGNLPYTYQWQQSPDGVNFTDIVGATGLDYQPGVLTQKTFYRQVQSSASGCGSFATNMVTMSIQQQPVVDIAVEEDITCSGASYQLSATAQNHESVSWTSLGDGTFDDVNILNPVYTPGAGDIANGSVVLAVNAMALSPCEMLASDQMVLSFYETPVVDAGEDLTIYENSEVQLNATVNGNGTYTYAWSPAEMVSDPTILNPLTSSIAQTTTFTLTVTDFETGCTTEDEVTYKVEAGVFYQISGKVESIGLKNSLPQTSVYFTGIDQSTFTNEQGEYSMQVPSGYSGWAIPSRAGYVFDPDSIAYFNVGEDVVEAPIGGTLYLRAVVSADSIIAGQSVELWVEFMNSSNSVTACSWQDETGEFCNTEIATVEPTQTTVYTVFVSDAYESTFDTVRVYVSITTGMDDLKMDEGLISLYPNPTKNIISLEISAELDAELISIVNPNGTLVRQIKLPKTANDHQIQINLEHLVDGTYYLIISNRNGKRLSSKKVVKI